MPLPRGDPADPRMTREMSSVECYLSDCVVSSVAVLSHSSRPGITVGQMSRAADSLARRHPSLRCALGASTSGHRRFLCAATASLDASDHIALSDLDPADDILPLPTAGGWLSTLHNGQRHPSLHMPGGSPWRIQLLQGSATTVLIFTFNHVIGDGCSGITALRDFLSLLSHEDGIPPLLATEDGLDIVELPPTPELRTVLSSSWIKSIICGVLAFVSRFDFFTRLLDPAWSFLPHLQTPGRVCAGPVPANFECSTMIRWGSSEGTSRLLAACKRNKSTVGGFIAAATGFLGGSLRPLAPGLLNNQTKVAISYDINWRPRLNPPIADAMGMLVSFDMLESRLCPGASKFWDYARSMTVAMRKKLAGGGAKSENGIVAELFYRLLKQGSSYLAYTDRRPGKIVYDFNLSNIGRWPWPNCTCFGRLGDLTGVFTGQAACPGKSMCGIVLFSSCVGGRMCLSLSYAKHVVPDRYAEMLIDTVHDFCEGKVVSTGVGDWEKAAADIDFGEFLQAKGGTIAESVPAQVSAHQYA